jgi:glyoxylase-like metal-dependent hydrolase (beta-lactamase superfamily II)
MLSVSVILVLHSLLRPHEEFAMAPIHVYDATSVENSQASAASPCPAPPPAPKDYGNGNPDAPYNPPGARNTDSCLPLKPTGEVVHDYTTKGLAPGDVVFRWIHGSVCAAKNTDPRIQVVAYNEDTYILRENPCVNWEAPFTYLLFGNHGALLIDTGATPEANYYPLRVTVDEIVSRWCGIRRKKSVPLTVVLTSGEDVAQNQGIGQFAERAQTGLTPLELGARMEFHGLSSSWKQGLGRIDLGGRVVEVIPTPGTHKDGLSFYDAYTCVLFTGDLLYAGRVQIANDRDYVASLERLQQWKQNHPVKWVMGGHVEMMFIPGRAYPRFSTNRPFEHVLQLEAETIDEAVEHARGVVGKPAVVFRTDFILLNRVSPDEKVYQSAPDLPQIPVPYWISLQ